MLSLTALDTTGRHLMASSRAIFATVGEKFGCEFADALQSIARAGEKG